jgi:hypothetical protein
LNRLEPPDVVFKCFFFELDMGCFQTDAYVVALVALANVAMFAALLPQ